MTEKNRHLVLFIPMHPELQWCTASATKIIDSLPRLYLALPDPRLASAKIKTLLKKNMESKHFLVLACGPVFQTNLIRLHYVVSK